MGIKRRPPQVSGRPWLDNDGNFLFGKFKGTSVGEVSLSDPGYLRWVLENVDDMHEEDRKIVEYWYERT